KIRAEVERIAVLEFRTISQQRCICTYGLFDRSNQSWRTDMAEKVKIWFDKDGDFLEVLFSDKPGYMRETANDAVMQRVDGSWQLLGFWVMHVSRVGRMEPLSAELRGKKPAA